MAVSSERDSRSPRSDSVLIAASRSGSALSVALRMAAARACSMVRLIAGSVSRAIAVLSAGRAAASREWNTASAAAARCVWSGESRRTAPRAAFTACRMLLLTRTGRTPAAVAGAPVAAFSSPVSVRM